MAASSRAPRRAFAAAGGEISEGGPSAPEPASATRPAAAGRRLPSPATRIPRRSTARREPETGGARLVHRLRARQPLLGARRGQFPDAESQVDIARAGLPSRRRPSCGAPKPRRPPADGAPRPRTFGPKPRRPSYKPGPRTDRRPSARQRISPSPEARTKSHRERRTAARMRRRECFPDMVRRDGRAPTRRPAPRRPARAPARLTKPAPWSPSPGPANSTPSKSSSSAEPSSTRTP